MPTFHKRFASLLVFVDHGFERSVIPGYLPRLTRPEPILYFFRDLHGIYPITQPALSKRTQDYPPWVAAFARNHPFPSRGPNPKGTSQASGRKTTRGPTSGPKLQPHTTELMPLFNISLICWLPE